MILARLILRLFGWTISVTAPDYPKCIICVAPHTSNWDFILGKLTYAAVGRKAAFMMKESWFFFPLGLLLKAIGGVAVPRGKGKGKSNLVEAMVQKFNSSKQLHLAITPEGTRSRVDKWHTGFLRIAMDANDVKILLGVIDYGKHHISVDKVFVPTGNIDADINAVKSYYNNAVARYPEKFSVNQQ